MHLCLRECEVIKEQDEIRAWTYKRKFWKENKKMTIKKSTAYQAKVDRENRLKKLPKFFLPITTYIPPPSRKQMLLLEHFKVKPATSKG
jgi:hypothetical protein